MTARQILRGATVAPRVATPLDIQLKRPSARRCVPTLTLVGTLSHTYEGFVVDASRGYLWATTDGKLWRYTYPGLANTTGSDVPFDSFTSGNLSTGAPALDADGRVYYVDANSGGGDHQTLWVVDPDTGTKAAVNTRFTSDPVLDVCWTWSPTETGIFGAEQTSPGDLWLIDASNWQDVDVASVTPNTGSSSPVVTRDGAIWRIINSSGPTVTPMRYFNGVVHEYDSEPGAFGTFVSYGLARCNNDLVFFGPGPQARSDRFPDANFGESSPWTDGVNDVTPLSPWQTFATPLTCEFGYIGSPGPSFTTVIHELKCCG